MYEIYGEKKFCRIVVFTGYVTHVVHPPPPPKKQISQNSVNVDQFWAVWLVSDHKSNDHHAEHHSIVSILHLQIHYSAKLVTGAMFKHYIIVKSFTSDSIITNKLQHKIINIWKWYISQVTKPDTSDS